MKALLKLSGQLLKGSGAEVVDREYVWALADAIHQAQAANHSLAIMVGGGNLYRFAANRRDERDRDLNAKFAHVRGLIGTIFNSLWLVDVFQAAGVKAALLTSAFADPQFIDAFSVEKAHALLDAGSVVILAGGTGQLGPSTDVGAVQFCGSLGISTLLKATHTVDGVYTADPLKDPTAQKLDHLTYRQAMSDHLAIMDEEALEQAQLSAVQTIVFSAKNPRNLTRVLNGETIGSTITSEVA